MLRWSCRTSPSGPSKCWPIFNSLASSSHIKQWGEYDMAFRHAAANDPTKLWSMTDQQIWTAKIGGPFCSSCELRGHTAESCPIKPHWQTASTLQLFTDAAGSIRYGAYFQGSWFQGKWPPHQTLTQPSMP